MTKNETLAIVNVLATIVEGKAISYEGITKEKMEHDISVLLPKVVEVVQVLQAENGRLSDALNNKAETTDLESGMPGVDQSDEEEDNDLVCLGWFCSELKIKQVSSLWQQVRCRDRSREMQDDVAIWFSKGFYSRNKKECGKFFTLLRKIAESKGWKVTAHLTFMQFARGGQK
jgi:hypothetical protein